MPTHVTADYCVFTTRQAKLAPGQPGLHGYCGAIDIAQECQDDTAINGSPEWYLFPFKKETHDDIERASELLQNRHHVQHARGAKRPRYPDFHRKVVHHNCTICSNYAPEITPKTTKSAVLNHTDWPNGVGSATPSDSLRFLITRFRTAMRA